MLLNMQLEPPFTPIFTSCIGIPGLRSQDLNKEAWLATGKQTSTMQKMSTSLRSRPTPVLVVGLLPREQDRKFVELVQIICEGTSTTPQTNDAENTNVASVPPHPGTRRGAAAAEAGPKLSRHSEADKLSRGSQIPDDIGGPRFKGLDRLDP